MSPFTFWWCGSIWHVWLQRLSVELVCAQDDKLLEVLIEELAKQSVFTSALQVNHFLDLEPKPTWMTEEEQILLD